MGSLMLLGMDTRLVVPDVLKSFFFGFFSMSYLVVDRERCFRWLVATDVPRCPVRDDILAHPTDLPPIYTHSDMNGN